MPGFVRLLAGASVVMVASGAVALLLPTSAGATTQPFTTPGTATFQVPAGVTSVDLVVTGAHGGTGSNTGNSGGVVTVTGVPVTPYTTLAILVGRHGTDGVATTPGTGGTGGMDTPRRRRQRAGRDHAGHWRDGWRRRRVRL